ncbi:2-oxo-4-hydroxy-4-carboxy-5-ureidoimidazoline decarboxylase [Nocardioides guangzhouensis]|uniref:2-oxo-4-hydroxy-4-carboxy-5-ureidoimidazoline decarboxylase n=1 Tax=Nocardioides guangzhouensis TaxID=2497878 RepID=A0A4Q4ZJ12_9ACTN|nr:2-oxo-4-hydroxy-4-carboxy-5-ureidoimidazoline decarboxylase [Nocardioides guangzhouensis]RYP88270.1 2-oxo-4-hydroxy-4-carboxy-5-ureidoimidazoline decarboxylase [Nocardioides guangzhouensis]
MEVTRFNALPVGAAREAVAGCLGVPRWVDEVVDGRPYADPADALARGRESARALTDDELTSALTRHPRIGERREDDDEEARMSRSEQAGVDPADAARLRAANAAYEQRFGRVFLVRAAGRSSAEILAELERRLGNDDAAEREETVTALRDIALLRLEGVLA